MIILLYSFSCSLIAVIFHIIINYLLKIDRKESPIHNIIRQAKLIFVLWIALLPTLLFVAFNLKPLQIDLGFNVLKVLDYLVGIILFSFLFFIYLSIYYIFDRSVSSEVMIAIENSRNKKLSILEIKRLYRALDKCDNELNGMLEGGFIFEQGGLFKNTLKGAIFAKYASLCKKIYKLGLGGY